MLGLVLVKFALTDRASPVIIRRVRSSAMPAHEALISAIKKQTADHGFEPTLHGVKCLIFHDKIHSGY